MDLVNRITNVVSDVSSSPLNTIFNFKAINQYHINVLSPKLYIDGETTYKSSK